MIFSMKIKAQIFARFESEICKVYLPCALVVNINGFRVVVVAAGGKYSKDCLGVVCGGRYSTRKFDKRMI